MPRAKRTPKKRTAGEWIPAFLAHLRGTGNVRYSCEKARIARRAAYDERDRNEQFRADWAEALEDACDALEMIALKRAQRNSDTLMIFLLKANRPEKYREQLAIQQSTRLTIEHDVRLSQAILNDDESADLACRLLERVSQPAGLGNASGPGVAG